MKTLGRQILARVEKQSQDPAIGMISGQEVIFLNFQQYFQKTETLSLALKKLGLGSENKVSLLAQTCPEWHFFDIAILNLRGIVVPIYPSYLPKEILFILNHSESSALILEDNEQFEKFLTIQNQVKFVHTVVHIKSLRPELIEKLNKKFTLCSYEKLQSEGEGELLVSKNVIKEEIEKQKPTDLASIIYTSGTTGEPKGAAITHEAFCSVLMNIEEFFRESASSKDRVLTFLPLSHVLGRIDSWLPVAIGLSAVYAESINKIVENIGLAKPSVMLAVPRIFEKIYDRIQITLEEGSFIKKAIFSWADKASARYYAKIEKQLKPNMKEILEEKVAFKLVFSKIYQRFGGRIRFFVSGGAPLSPDIVRFLRKAHLSILEGYGLTETIAPCFVNPYHKPVLNSVGTPLPNTQAMIAEDGEILIKSNALFSEYYKNPEATEATLKDGWLYTGDIGHINEEGYLFITDRKKDLIITSGGKNVAPQMIENMMKLERHIAQFVVIGDKRKFLTGVVGVEKEAFEDQWDKLGLAKDCSFQDFASHPYVRTVVGNEIEKVNNKLARFETIKNFYIAPLPFTIDSGLLTPSQKVKRKQVLESFKEAIDAMYQE